MKIYFMLAMVMLAATCIQCSRPATAPDCPIEFSDDFTISQGGAEVRGRVYVFGSLNILSGVTFSDQLNAHGIQVVSMAIPQIAPCLYRDGGTAYRNVIVSAVNSVFEKVNAKYGSAKSFIGGGSIGGIHAMMGYALVPHFDGWFASMSVTKMTALAEFKGLENPVDFDPFGQVDRLKGSIGFITWGTADTRVDFHLSQSLYEQIKPIDHIEYAGLEHATTPQQINDLVEWIVSRF